MTASRALQRIDLGDDHPGAHALGPHGQTPAAPAVARHHQDAAGKQAVGGPDDAIDGALAGAVAVVEEILGVGVVHRDHGVAQHPVHGHGLQADNPGGGLFAAAPDARDEFLALGMDGEDQVGPVVHTDLGFEIQSLVDVAVIGVAVFPLDGEGGDLLVLGEKRGHVVLGAQGVTGAQGELGAAGLEGHHQRRSFGGDVQAGGQAHPLQGLFLGKALTDGGQYGHFPHGPLHPERAFVGQIYIVDIKIHE